MKILLPLLIGFVPRYETTDARKFQTFRVYQVKIYQRSVEFQTFRLSPILLLVPISPISCSPLFCTFTKCPDSCTDKGVG